MMTERQSETLHFIGAYQRTHGGVSPSVAEIARAIKRSKGNVHALLVGLENRGFIRRLPRRERAIEIVRKNRVAMFKFDDSLKELVPFKQSH